MEADREARPAVDTTLVQPEMDVLAADGEIIGGVKEVRQRDFLVERSMLRDIYVPFSAVREIVEYRVILNVIAKDIDDQPWEKAGLFG